MPYVNATTKAARDVVGGSVNIYLKFSHKCMIKLSMVETWLTHELK